VLPKKRKKKPQQKPWLRRETLNSPLENSTPTHGAAIALPDTAASKPVIIGPRLLDRHQVCATVGASYPSIWSWMRAGTFPRSRIVGGKTKWFSSDIDAWMASLPVRRLKGDAS
jgi:prophage regulatory protein